MTQIWTVDILSSRMSDPDWFADLIASHTVSLDPTPEDVAHTLHNLLPEQKVCEAYLTLEEQIAAGGESWFDIYFESIPDGNDQIGYVAYFRRVYPERVTA